MLFVPEVAKRITEIKKLQAEDNMSLDDIRKELTKIKSSHPQRKSVKVVYQH